MTDDRSLERAARSWLEEGPTRAPDRPVEAALARIQTTHQERVPWVPWRIPIMNPALRLAGAAVVAAVALGAVVLALRPGPNVGSAGSNPPVTTAPATAPGSPLSTEPVVRPIADGSYQADIPVADLLTLLDRDPTLTPAEKTTVIDTMLAIRDAETLHVQVRIADDVFQLLQSVDDRPLMPAADPWRITAFDKRSITVRTGLSSDSATATYAIDGGLGPEYMFRPLTPAATAVETFVRRAIFQSEWFTPVP